MIRRALARVFGAELAIDLGTANTVIHVRGEGITLSQPSVVAMYRDEWGQPQIESIGEAAKNMLGRTPEDLTIVRPIRDGVISNFEVTTAMLRCYMQLAVKRSFVVRPTVVIAVPAGLNDVERRAVREAAVRAGAGEVFLIEEAVAAAIGAGFDVNAPDATMVVDIGGGTTEIALISCSGIIYSRSARIGGDVMDQAIIQFVRRNHSVLIGELTAERIKVELATSLAGPRREVIEVKGRDLITDAPRTIEIKRQEVTEALREPIAAVVDRVRLALEGTPPETSADIADKGILLVGGGSLLSDLGQELERSTGLKVTRCAEPLRMIAEGAGRCLEDEFLRSRLTLRVGPS